MNDKVRTHRTSVTAQAAPPGKLKRKEYDEELAKLHVELVKVQEWVKATGAKVCIVFEGRDGAGKGGTIKAITERVSPRVFRVIALPAPSDREKSQMYGQRYLPHLPAAGEVVIWDRSWYNRAGVERVMGFCTEEQAKNFLEVVPLFEKLMTQVGDHPAEVLARGEPRRADAAPEGPHRGRPQDLETLADGRQVLHALGRLHPRARRHVPRHRHQGGAVVRGQFERQEAAAPEPDHAPAAADPVQGMKRDKVTLPKRKVSEQSPAARRRMRFIKEVY